MAIQDCCRRLDQHLEASGERVEANSTRIFNLAAEVEGLAEAIRRARAGTGTRPLGIAREDARDIFAVELADLPPDEKRTGDVGDSSADEAEHPREGDGCDSSDGRIKDHPSEAQIELVKERARVPGHPGVLSQDVTEEEPGARAGFLAGRLQQAVSPPVWHRRDLTRSGGRASAPSRSKAGLIAGPVRPKEDRPATTSRTSRSRALSWPLLSKETSSRDCDTNANGDVEHENKHFGRRYHSMPDLEESRSYGIKPGILFDSIQRALSALPFHHDADPAGAPGCEHQLARGSDHVGNSPEPHQLGQDEAQDETRQSLAPLNTLVRMTANEVAEALNMTCVGKKRVHRSTELDFDDSLVRSASPGSRLAGLGDTPDRKSVV